MRRVVERWTIEGMPGMQRRTLVNVSGRSISSHEQVRVVKESDYDALADHLAGAVEALQQLDGMSLSARSSGHPLDAESVAAVCDAALSTTGGQSDGFTVTITRDGVQISTRACPTLAAVWVYLITDGLPSGMQLNAVKLLDSITSEGGTIGHDGIVIHVTRDTEQPDA